MKIKVIPMKGGFPPDIGGVLTEALVETQREARFIAEKTAMYLQGITPSRTGFMRSTARHWDLKIYGRGSFAFWIGWRRRDYSGKKAFYPPYVNYGTGVFGLYGTPIRPISARRLAWQHRGQWVSAKEVKGQRPQKQLDKVERYGVRLIRERFQNAVIRTMKSKFR